MIINWLIFCKVKIHFNFSSLSGNFARWVPWEQGKGSEGKCNRAHLRLECHTYWQTLPSPRGVEEKCFNSTLFGWLIGLQLFPGAKNTQSLPLDSFQRGIQRNKLLCIMRQEIALGRDGKRSWTQQFNKTSFHLLMKWLTFPFTLLSLYVLSKPA